MGLLRGEHHHDFDRKRESEVPLIDENRENRQRECDIDIHHHYHHQYHPPVEFDVDFWPVEHPMEPQDEDRPVKCPIPNSSSVLNDERNSESMQERAEHRRIVKKEGIVIVGAEPPMRAVRKRQHTLTNGDHIITPSLRKMPSLPPLPTTTTTTQNNITIFQMLQQLDEFEC